VIPKEGAIAFKTTIHIVKNTQNKELAVALIEAAMTPEVQTKLMQSPYLVVPTNSKVKMEGEISKVLAKDQDEMKNVSYSRTGKNQRTTRTVDRAFQ